MSLQKISAITIIALSLAACSSGSDSNGNNQPNVNPSVTNPSNGNTSVNTTPRVDFSVSYQGLKSNANEAVQYLAKEFGVDDATLQSYTVKLGNQTSKGKELNLSGYPLKKLALNQDFQETAIARAEGKNYTITQSGKAHIYRQNYSKRLFEKAATPTKSITPKLRDTVFKALPTVAIMLSASSALMRKKSSVRSMTVKSVSPAPANLDVIQPKGRLKPFQTTFSTIFTALSV